MSDIKWARLCLTSATNSNIVVIISLLSFSIKKKKGTDNRKWIQYLDKVVSAQKSKIKLFFCCLHNWNLLTFFRFFFFVIFLRFTISYSRDYFYLRWITTNSKYPSDVQKEKKKNTKIIKYKMIKIENI